MNLELQLGNVHKDYLNMWQTMFFQVGSTRNGAVYTTKAYKLINRCHGIQSKVEYNAHKFPTHSFYDIVSTFLFHH